MSCGETSHLSVQCDGDLQEENHRVGCASFLFISPLEFPGWDS